MSRVTRPDTADAPPIADSGDEVDDLVTAVLTASRVLVAVSARSLESVRNSVTLTQFRTLVVLQSRRGTNLHGLATLLGVNSSTAVRTIDRLVSRGYVLRRDNPDNRREVQLSLTAAGRRLVERVTEARRGEIATIVAGMATNRRKELVAALTAFADAADEPQVDIGTAAVGW